jgi:hypothetical protein
MKAFIITKNNHVVHAYESQSLAEHCLEKTALQLCKEGYMIVSSDNNSFTLSKGGQQVVIKIQETELTTNVKVSFIQTIHNWFN